MSLTASVAFLLAFALAALDSKEFDLNPLFSALQEHRFQAALTIAKQLKSRSPSDPRLWTLEGMANEGNGDKSEAIRDYEGAIRLNPDYLPALKAQAQLEYQNGSAKARLLLDRIVRLQPADPTSHAMLAALAYKGRDCSTTIAEYRLAAVVLQSNAEALTQYGDCLLRDKQSKQAQDVLSQVVALRPADWTSHYNLAVALLADGQAKAAVIALDPLVSASAVRPEVLNLAAEAAEESGDTPRAVELFRRAILSDPKNENYYLRFANLCFDHQSFQAGVDMLNAGLTQIPRSPNLHLARGILFGQLGDFAKAESDFDAADRLDGTGTISGAASSLAQLQNSNLTTALQIARSKLKTSPNDPMLQYVKAATLKQMGVEPGTPEFREAVTAASDAVRLQPNFAAARNLLGSFLMQENQLGKATQQFRAVLQEDPADQTALYHLIQSARKSGQTAEIPSLVNQLAKAKAIQRQRDEAAGKYRLVTGAK